MSGHGFDSEVDQNRTKKILPGMHNGKSSAAPPTVAEDKHPEVAKDGNSDAKLPLLEDVMQLARLGDIGSVQQLLQKGEIGADFHDEEGITPLHWAAINNHYGLCKFLVESGSDVNARGGEAGGYPAMWAAQRCNYYIVHLLLQSGADPLLTDAQGYNLLHLATFDGNVFLLTLILHQNIPIDVPDPQGHTCLMWAAYKGYPACVDLFLRWGASVSITDESGFTALHWAVTKGSQACMQKLIEYGSNRIAETLENKTPTSIANDMKTTHQWRRALNDCGYDHKADPKQIPLPFGSVIKQRGFIEKFFFLYPFAVLFIVIYVLSDMVIYAAVPIAIFAAISTQWAAQHLLLWAPPDLRHIHRTPYLSGVFAATCFWVGARWLSKIVPNTYKRCPVLNISFAAVYSLCAYFYIISMIEDPGHVPKSNGRNQQKAVIDELLGLWKFDNQNFCVQCMIRAPLRSKHCHRCKRCIAKHDHHCPWINNCVGNNNHRQFFLYILFLAIGIILFVRLVLIRVSPPDLENSAAPEHSQCNILAEGICDIILRDTFTAVLAIWSTLQLTWVTMLLFVQLVQISRAKTTYESMRGHTQFDYKAAEAVTAALTTGATTMSDGQLTGGDLVSGNHSHSHGHKEGCFKQWKKLLGLDSFMATAQSGLKGEHRSTRRNPFSRGVLTNCKDFWCDPAPYFSKRETGAAMLDGTIINYTRMYESPPRLKLRRSDRSGSERYVYNSVTSDDSV